MLVLTLFLTLVPVQNAGDWRDSIKFGFPFVWRELHLQEVCQPQGDCLVGGYYTTNWIFLYYDLAFDTGLVILAIIVYHNALNIRKGDKAVVVVGAAGGGAVAEGEDFAPATPP